MMVSVASARRKTAAVRFLWFNEIRAFQQLQLPGQKPVHLNSKSMLGVWDLGFRVEGNSHRSSKGGMKVGGLKDPEYMLYYVGLISHTPPSLKTVYINPLNPKP